MNYDLNGQRYRAYIADPEVTERIESSELGIALSILSLMIILVGILASYLFLRIRGTEIALMSLALGIFYLFLTYLLIRPKSVTEIREKYVEEVPVVQEVVREIEKPVYLEKEKEAEYVGSMETKTYHKGTCRFAKSILGEYKISDDDPKYFKNMNYKKCKVCMKK